MKRAGLAACCALFLAACSDGNGKEEAGGAVGPVPEKAAGAPEERSVLRSKLGEKGWYDAGRDALSRRLKGYLDEVQDEPLEGICALILPHAGYEWSGQTAAHGVKQIAGRPFSRVVVVGPSHHAALENMASVPEATHYGTPLGEVTVDRDFVKALRKHPQFGSVSWVHENEHSVQMEVPLLQQALGDFLLVPIVVGDVDPKTTKAIAEILLGLIDERTLVVASSDFTHYGRRFGYTPFAEGIPENLEKLDMRAFGVLQKRDPAAFRAFLEETGDTICGRNAILVLLEMLPRDAKAHLLKYDTSGRRTKDYGGSVSYLSIAFCGTWPKAERVKERPPSGGLSGKEQEDLLSLARRTLRIYLEERRMPKIEEMGLELAESMQEPRGAFVTLHRRGELRGCIGSILPRRPLYKEVMGRVVDSAVNDTRFHPIPGPVTAEELPELRIEISVLTVPVEVASHREIVVGRHGVLLQKGHHSAVFLPQVAPEQGWGVEETLSHLARKAGLPADGWKEGATFKVFEAQVFAEPER